MMIKTVINTTVIYISQKYDSEKLVIRVALYILPVLDMSEGNFVIFKM